MDSVNRVQLSPSKEDFIGILIGISSTIYGIR
jgi:hypothetical protein